jgi:glycosyltransferase involved in cell wall biosynthesis
VRIAIVHDYLTQRGGAERVVLSMLRAFPDAALYTSIYAPNRTFPEFRRYDVQTLPVNAVAPFRRHHRAALPLLAASFAGLRVDADVTLCSSSGWAHGANASGRKVVYCHAPARWLYQTDRYISRGGSALKRWAAGSILRCTRRQLLRWDGAAAASADAYVVNSRAVQEQVRAIYGIEAYVLHPPITDLASLPPELVPGVDPGFLLVVSRLLPYKNVDIVVEAMRRLRDQRLIIAGEGPERRFLQAVAPSNVRFLGQMNDRQLAWLYRTCSAVIAASYEDFGLVPIEAAAHGKPTVALAAGGFLDTVVDGRTGVLFEPATAVALAAAVRRLGAFTLYAGELRSHAVAFSQTSFAEGLRAIVLGNPLPYKTGSADELSIEGVHRGHVPLQAERIGALASGIADATPQ